ncbi:MAG TPA: hypothetical protein ENG61_03400 [Candidatus Korarchaeota archaeon]|nr:hypothetical protein [Candidatus Korarchaeota archaeon]
MKKVPLGISAINSLLLTISAILLATGLSGLLDLPEAPLNPFLRVIGVKLEVPRPDVYGGIVSIIVSIIIFAVALGLGRAKLWAFFTAVFLFALSAILGALNILSNSLFAILTVLVSLLCLTYLIGSPKVRSFLKEEEPKEEVFPLNDP